MTGENFSLMELANMELVYWSVRSFSKTGEDRVKVVEGGSRYFSPLKDSLY